MRKVSTVTIIAIIFTSCFIGLYVLFPPLWLHGYWEGGGWKLSVDADDVIIYSPYGERIDIALLVRRGECYIDESYETPEKWFLGITCYDYHYRGHIRFTFEKYFYRQLKLTIKSSEEIDKVIFMDKILQ